MQSILAIFKDEHDAGSWAAYLDGISALWSITARNDLWESLQRVIRFRIDPAVVIVSSRLYPAESPEVAAKLRTYFPQAELLLLSCADDPAPSLLQLSDDAVRHLEVKPREGQDLAKDYFRSALRNLLAGRAVAIEDRLTSPESVKTFEFTSSDQKEDVLTSLCGHITGEGDDVEMFRQRAALLADELIENAFYGAPKGAQGEQLFRKGESRQVFASEQMVFRFGFDGDTLAMEMVDNWGTLDPDLVVEYLARNQAQQESADEIGGRGLFLIWRFFDHFHISVYPGRKTVVGGDLQLSRPLDPEAPRGYHISEHTKGDTA